MSKIALVDDHVLMRKGLASLVRELGHEVILQADNGRILCEKLPSIATPDIIMLDINMPEMDGYRTAAWLKKNYPTVKILVLSMIDDEQSVIRMIRLGAKGYILKDCEPEELKRALDALTIRGYYHTEIVADILFNAISDEKTLQDPNWGLSERELEFLQWACSDLTYREIAAKMFVSTRTVDDYRDELYKKLNIKSRVGLVLFAIRQGLCKV